VQTQIPDNECRDVPRNEQHACKSGAEATISFLTRLIEDEQPDLVVHTGDIVDWDTHPSSAGMDVIYGISIKAGVKWAASLGNHDDDSDLTRPEVMDYIMSMDGGSTLSQNNPLGGGSDDPDQSYGNFVLELFNSTESAKPSFRTFHLDANTNDYSFNDEQVAWFADTAAAYAVAAPAPSVAFFHIPLGEYVKALLTQAPMTGHVREVPCPSIRNSGMFDAFKADGSVKATFVGHDHTNDFCALYEGIQLCYEGSPGYQSYGHCDVKKQECYDRRARITEVAEWGAVVNSWKRVDDITTRPHSSNVIDRQVLWAADGRANTLAEPSAITEADLAELPHVLIVDNRPK
jgi:3',5'-cyclic AMP phosphodiesterase CpdA